MDNNQWNQNNNQWNGNQQAGQWNGNNVNGYNQNYSQTGYNQNQGYGQPMPPLGQQVNLQQQYNQQQAYGAPVHKTKKGHGCLITLLVIMLLGALAVFGIIKGIGGWFGDKKDKEPDNVVIEQEETREEAEEDKEETQPTEEVQLDEMVEGKIPTPEELGDVLKSLEFSQVYIHDDSTTAYTMDVDYQIFDNRMAAEIRYEAILDTINDKVNAKHDTENSHLAYEIVQTTERDGYKIVQVLKTSHNKDCTLSQYSNPYSVEVYILKGNTILDYCYDMDHDKVQGSTPRSLEKALEKIEYVTVDKIEFTENEVETEVIEEETTENTVEDAVTDAQEATDKITEALDNIEEATSKDK